MMAIVVGTLPLIARVVIVVATLPVMARVVKKS